MKVANTSSIAMFLLLGFHGDTAFGSEEGRDSSSHNLRSLAYYGGGRSSGGGGGWPSSLGRSSGGRSSGYNNSPSYSSRPVPSFSMQNDDTEFTFVAEATGEQEQPPVGPVDTKTTGTLTLQFDRTFTSAAFKIDVFNGQGIDRLHIHCGLAGIGGPVVAEPFNIQPEGQYAQGTLSEGILTNEDIMYTDFLADERCGIVINNIASLFEAASQRSLYLNVHSLDNPDGVVRGQLLPVKKSEY